MGETRRPPVPGLWLFFGASLALGLVLKAWYSVADVGALRWILAPTAGLVAAATGASFVTEPATGYLSTELRLLIAPACAGVNFLVVMLWSGHLGLLPLVGGTRGRALFFAGWTAAAYAVTVVVNALRILVSVALANTGWGPWVTGPSLHRVEGVVVYVASLCAVFLAARGVLLRSGQHESAA